MIIYAWFTYQKWGLAIVLLVYQKVQLFFMSIFNTENLEAGTAGSGFPWSPSTRQSVHVAKAAWQQRPAATDSS